VLRSDDDGLIYHVCSISFWWNVGVYEEYLTLRYFCVPFGDKALVVCMYVTTLNKLINDVSTARAFLICTKYILQFRLLPFYVKERDALRIFVRHLYFPCMCGFWASFVPVFFFECTSETNYVFLIVVVPVSVKSGQGLLLLYTLYPTMRTAWFAIVLLHSSLVGSYMTVGSLILIIVAELIAGIIRK
jgi:hypothetical protein